jgi:hypothetical protein
MIWLVAEKKGEMEKWGNDLLKMVVFLILLFLTLMGSDVRKDDVDE